MPTTNPRVSTVLQPAEADAFEARAAARGVRPAELLRSLVLAYLRDGEAAAAPAPAASPADLAAAAASLERTAGLLVSLLPAAEAVAEGQEYVRRSLDEIAAAVGSVAGAIVPLEPGEDNFGLGIGR
ncbi:hypothetical protein [Roseicella aquatilis]|uniref:Uncharacterized protein n=1 Tax=Roseicella aquatilis TaxID=2527868 RepID=A0A4R4DXI0_9PROT|nr:hypothetical protein [Roseicella aquatilis]TCZ65560.1 hypothetical protein EXY23_05165 [Roseicella aquatilis]